MTTQSMTSPVLIEIGAQSLQLRFDRRAQYRLQSLDKDTDLTQFRNPRKRFAVLVNWLWACALDCPFAKPEDLANGITDDDDVVKLAAAVVQCVNSATAPTEQKKTISENGPSPAGVSA